jgi:hypothetical protein
MTPDARKTMFEVAADYERMAAYMVATEPMDNFPGEPPEPLARWVPAQVRSGYFWSRLRSAWPGG